MGAEHEFLKKLLRGGTHALAPDGKPYEWSRIAAAMDAITTDPSGESLEVLDRVLKHTHKVPVRSGAERPHLFTPREALQLRAIQALAAWDPQSEGLAQEPASLIERFATATESVTLEGIARFLLSRLGGDDAGGVSPARGSPRGRHLRRPIR